MGEKFGRRGKWTGNRGNDFLVKEEEKEEGISQKEQGPETRDQRQKQEDIMDQLNYNEQQQFQKIVEQKQMADFMRLYTSLVDRCFNDCVNDFTSENLTDRENSCLTKCAEKFLKHSERVGTRFQEQNQKLMTQMRQ